jgi:hypothetical protein
VLATPSRPISTPSRPRARHPIVSRQHSITLRIHSRAGSPRLLHLLLVGCDDLCHPTRDSIRRSIGGRQQTMTSSRRRMERMYASSTCATTVARSPCKCAKISYTSTMAPIPWVEATTVARPPGLRPQLRFFAFRCRGNAAHVRQSGPDSGLCLGRSPWSHVVRLLIPPEPLRYIVFWADTAQEWA